MTSSVIKKMGSLTADRPWLLSIVISRAYLLYMLTTTVLYCLGHLGRQKKRKSPALPLVWLLAIVACTIVAVFPFHGRVRDVSGWFQKAIAALPVKPV